METIFSITIFMMESIQTLLDQVQLIITFAHLFYNFILVEM